MIKLHIIGLKSQIGKSLTSLLIIKKNITITDINDASHIIYLKADVLDISASLRKNTYYDVNYNNLEKLVDFCKSKKKKFVFLSSCSLYEKMNTKFFLENQKIKISQHYNTYQLTKFFSEMYIKNNLNSNSYLILRPTSVFGIDMPDRQLFKKISYHHKNNNIFEINGSDTLNNYIPVDYLSKKILLHIQKKSAGEYLLPGLNIYLSEIIGFLSSKKIKVNFLKHSSLETKFQFIVKNQPKDLKKTHVLDKIFEVVVN